MEKRTQRTVMKQIKHSREEKDVHKDVFCPLCGIPLSEHPYCRICTILVGPGHIETALTNGLCASCFRASRLVTLKSPQRVRQRAKTLAASR